jgi:hypothetical protein
VSTTIDVIANSTHDASDIESAAAELCMSVAGASIVGESQDRPPEAEGMSHDASLKVSRSGSAPSVSYGDAHGSVASYSSAGVSGPRGLIPPAEDDGAYVTESD